MKNKYDLVIGELITRFSDIKKILAVYIYGSVARGDFSLRHSDLDLFIIINEKYPSKILIEKINNKVIAFGLKFGVKIHPEYQGLIILKEDNTLIRKIIEEGKIIYSAGVFNFMNKQIGLKQYIIYEFFSDKSKRKSYFSKILHGKKSWYYKGNEKIVKEYPGIVDNKDIINIGRGALLVIKEKQKIIENLFKEFKIDYKIKRIVYT